MDAKPEKRWVIRDDVATIEPTFVDHHATCPQAEAWTKRKDVS
jgi:hypothetical protein